MHRHLVSGAIAVLAAVGWITSLTACSRDEPDSRTTAGGGGGTGGSGTGAGTAIGGTASGGGGNAGSGGLAGKNGNLGRSCESAAECGPGLDCYRATDATFDGEGAPKGYCSVECTTNETICAQFDPTSACVTFANAKAYCFKGCTLGPDCNKCGGFPPPINPPPCCFDDVALNPNKCWGRSEVACRLVGGGIASACLPQCNSDTDCEGSYCNPRTGFCASAPATGLALGTPCTPPTDGGTDPCKGYCTTLLGVNTMSSYQTLCGESCTFGATGVCGWNDPTAPAPAGCFFFSLEVFDYGGPGLGDRGTCGVLCNCNSECNAAGLVCLPDWGYWYSAATKYYSKKGYCGDPTLPNDGGVDPGIPTCD